MPITIEPRRPKTQYGKRPRRGATAQRVIRNKQTVADQYRLRERKRRKGVAGPQRGMDPKNPRKRLEEVNPRPAPKAPQDPRGRPTVPDRIKERFKKFNPLIPGMSGLPMKPLSRLTGGQMKIAAKAPPRNKIDGKDFAVLKAEKAKGRGRGLQDEKLKPGKVTKAFAGALAVGLSAKNRMTGGDKKKRAPVGMGGIGASMIKAEAMKKILGRNKGGMGKVMKANSGKIADMSFDEKMKRVKAGQIDKKTGKFKSINAMRDAKGFQKGETTKQFNKRRMLLSRAKDVAKSNKYGRIALGVAAAGMAGIQYLKSKMKKNEKKPQKKMGGGMMMQRPMMASEGRFTSRDVQAAKDALKIKKAKPGDRGYNQIKRAYETLKSKKKMGGGMMMRPNPVGYKKGVLVKVKLGRNKPTKLY